MSARTCAVVVFASAVLTGAIARAQEPLKFARLSTAATPARATARGVLREQRIELGSVSDLFQQESGRTIQLDLFPDLSIVAVRERVEISPAARVWVGTIPAYAGGNVAISSSGDELVATIWTLSGTYRIERASAAGYFVEQLDPAVSSGSTDDAVVPPPSIGANGVKPAASADSTSKDDGSVIDVMVLYTTASLAAWGSVPIANAAVSVDVASVNTAFLNSHIASRVRLVYSGAVDYVEAGDSLTDLARLQAPNDGFLDSVQALRNSYAADLVQLIVTDADNCGRGYVRTSPLQDSSFAFSLVSRNCVANQRTTAHEWGHNFGLQHDWYVTDTRGYFTDSHGYVSLQKGFYDLMAYPTLCGDTRTSCVQLFQYASPAILKDGAPTGVPAGTDLSCRAGQTTHTGCDADGVRTILTTLSQVAQYRDSATNTRFPQLLSGQSIFSNNRQFSLTYQADGNLVLVNLATNAPIWYSQTGQTQPGVVLLQSDGNLVIFNASGAALWSSGTGGHPNASLALQDDGNLVVYGADGKPLWDAFSHPPPR